jgi:hypothetical protein
MSGSKGEAMRTRAAIWQAFGVVLILMFSAGAAAQTLLCEPSAEVRVALRNLPDANTITGGSQAVRAARIEALRALLERFPRDVFLHQRYQDAVATTEEDRNAIVAEYRRLADSNRGDPLYAYLAARAQVGVRTEDVLPELETLAETMPPARLALVRIYQSPAFTDGEKALEQIEEFMSACPASLEATSMLRSLEPSDFLTETTAKLRLLLAGRSEPELLAQYSTLWSLEFRVRPASEHDTLRGQVAKDLERLRAIDPGRNQAYYSMLQEGYKLLPDNDGIKWVAEQIRTRFPATAYSSVSQQWRNENPYPKKSDPPERRKAFQEDYLKVTGEWVRRWPQQVTTWWSWVSAMDPVEDVAAEDVEAAGEGLLKAVAENPGQMSFYSPRGGSSFSLLVAYLYASKGVRPDRLPDLIRDGLAEIENPVRLGLESDLYPRPPDDSSQDFTKWYAALTVADVWLKTKNAELARPAIDRVRVLADQSKPKVPPDPEDKKQIADQRTFLSRQVDYWSRMGELAELEGRKTDAMTFYQNALLARSSYSTTTSAARDTLGEQARRLWDELGGSTEAWLAWSERTTMFGGALPEALKAGGGPAWEKMEKALPEFELADLLGTKWRLDDFRGKTTLINVWAMT